MQDTFTLMLSVFSNILVNNKIYYQDNTARGKKCCKICINVLKQTNIYVAMPMAQT